MVGAVITINLFIALTCFYLAWRIWQLRNFLARVAKKLTAYERATRRGLRVSPPAILLAQAGTYRLRERYQAMELQGHQAQQIWLLISWAASFWNRATIQRGSRPRKNAKKLS